MSMTAAPLGASPDEHEQRFLAGGMIVVLAIASAKLLLHLAFNNRYDYFRDEFDYLSCGNHLAWGYVDQPPLIPFLARISRMTLGDSLRAIRFVPALAASAIVVVGAMIARELGGKRFALILTAITILISPVYLSAGSLLTTNCLEPLLWMLCAYCAILAVKRKQPRFWLWFGAVAGIGMEEKYSIAIFGFALVVGLLCTEQRRFLLSKWMWIGGLVALLIFLPNLLWNEVHHWPFLELMRNIKADQRDVALTPWQYFSQQILLIHPANALIWITGLLALFFWPKLRNYRFLAWTYVVALALFIILKGKNYYLAPIYPMLLAAGAVTFEHAIGYVRQDWLKPLIMLVLLAAGAWLAPLTVPVLSIDQFLAYQSKLPIKIPRTEHSHMGAALPQHYADQFGWREIVAETAVAWSRLTPGERPDCGIFAQDYGQAGAIDFFGPRYGLPPALSGHQTWFLWGPRGYSGNCLIVLDDDEENLQSKFNYVEFVGRSANNPYALEREIPVFICKGGKNGPMSQWWPHVKKWR
jgi:hypothetical protein